MRNTFTKKRRFLSYSKKVNNVDDQRAPVSWLRHAQKLPVDDDNSQDRIKIDEEVFAPCDNSEFQHESDLNRDKQ